MKTKHRFGHLQIIAIGYFTMIFVGTLLLMLPISTRADGSADFLTSLFTATSASCVTGLVVKDTATYWSLFGQFVIIFLIQIGGLGFMTIATFFLKIAKHKTGLRERAVMAESINTTRMSDFSTLTKRIIKGTALFEITGALLLSARFVPQFGFFKGVYYGFFHSVSAFCNAGFDLMGAVEPYSSFVSKYDDVVINLTVMLLIVIGGIGFLVWDDVVTNGLKFKKYSLHTKIVLASTAILIFGGALLMYLFEFDATEVGMDQKGRILSSLFGSVTARTAGFNTTDTEALTPASKLLTIILMFIGGSSSSTAGGVKTTTVAVVFTAMIATMRGHEDIVMFKRHISDKILKKAVIILSINLFLGLVGGMLICAIQDFNLTDVLFETFSAIGTVGMTTGITRDLTTVSRIVIIFLMYCGRVGSISFAIALFEHHVKPPVSYPIENITVG